MNAAHSSEDAPPWLPFFTVGKTGETEMSHPSTRIMIPTASTSHNLSSESDGNISENSKDTDMVKVNESCIS